MSIKYNTIQYLRAIAALSVAVLHWSGGVGLRPLHGGVDLFFVISGFVMVTSTHGRGMTFARFMTARIERIVPLYWIATAWAGLAMIGRGHWPTLRDWVLSLLFVPHTSGLRTTLSTVPILGPGWTLSYEMFFYLLFGATLFLKPKRQAVVLTALFAGLFALHPFASGATASTFTGPLLFEFLAGSFIGWWSLRPRPILPLAWAAALLVAGIGFGAAVHIFAPGTQRVIAFGIPAVAIVIAAVASEHKIGARPVKPLVFLGDASYAIYLFHVLLWPLAPLVAGSHAVVGLAVTIAGCCLIHVAIEKPLTKLVKGHYWRPRLTAAINPLSELPK
jgi:exopolysaccharide production protein ExoZ